MDKSLDITLHLESFVDAFVIKQRRERWKEFLCKRTDKAYKNSSKLHGHLDHRCLEENDTLNGIISLETIGVFYEFSGEPRCVTFEEAFAEGYYHDAIFSITPGKLAIYFFHEGRSYICRK